MAKELDKYKKDYAPLKKTADWCVSEYAVHTTNREHHKQMLLEASKETGRVAQQLKDNGATGTKLSDFANAKEMAPVMKAAMDAVGALGKEESRLKQILAKASDSVTSLEKLSKEISAEVADRKKKRDRKIAGVDSKSLPELEKLGGEVWSTRSQLVDDIINMQKIEKWSQAKVRADFDKWCAEEIGRTKSDRKTRDTKETDDQAFNVRIVQREMGKVKQIVDGVRSSCAAAEKHFKNREAAKADAELTKAWKLHAELKKIYEPYRRKLASLNTYDRRGMQESKDGKAVLDAIEQMEKAVDGLSKMIKKYSRATV